MGAQPRWVRDDSERLFYMGAGPLAAIVLGMALVPLRGLTHASNFTFAFLILTIVAAELGGRGPGLLTALVSALSLDFFLTQPYLRLRIDAKDDIIAFVGLGVCGLVAAALGSRRNEDPQPGNGSREHLEFLHQVLRALEATAPLDAALTRVLGAARGALPLSGAVVRDGEGHVLASAEPADRARPAPAPSPEGAARTEVTESGGSFALTAGGRVVGSLDVWGDGRRWSTERLRALGTLIAILGLAVQGARGVTR